MTLSARQLVEGLLDQFEPKIRDAFLDAIDDIRSAITLKIIVERLEKGDIQGAIEALNIDVTAYQALQEEIRQTYIGGGISAVGNMPKLRDPNGARLVIRFDVRNPRAEAWLRENSGQLVTRITEDQREAARIAMRDGMERGENPRSTALDIVGRVNRVTGRREGGIIGLTTRQGEFVRAARAELLSGEPTQLRSYLSRQRRDRRFDRTILKAIREGKPLDPATVQRITARYADNLLRLRGETIARTEALQSLNQSQREAYEQAIERGNIDRQNVRKAWRSARDSRVRWSHRELDGESVGIDEAFVTPRGYRMKHPGDASLGAPANEIVSCRCVAEYRIDFLANVR